jgi:hypothetical protein
MLNIEFPTSPLAKMMAPAANLRGGVASSKMFGIFMMG